MYHTTPPVAPTKENDDVVTEMPVFKPYKSQIGANGKRDSVRDILLHLIGQDSLSLDSDGLTPNKPATKFNVGDKVICHLKNGDLNAIVKFIGKTQFGSGIWVGVELTTGEGKNDGEIQGVRYFTCPEKKGLFLRPTMLEKDTLSSSIPLNPPHVEVPPPPQNTRIRSASLPVPIGIFIIYNSNSSK